MEHVQRYIPVRHTLDKAGGRLLIVIGRKGGGKPKAKGPGRRQRRFAGQLRIFGYGSLRGGTVNHVVIEPFPFHGKLQAFHLFAGNLIGGIPLMIQKHAIPLVGNIKRNILVGDFTGRSAILIPHFHHLAVLHKRGVPLTKSIDALVHIDGQLLHHIGFSRIPVGHMGHVAESGVGQFPVSVEETDSPAVRPLIDNRRCAAALIADLLLCFLDCHMGGGLLNPGEGAAVSGSLKMPHGNLNHIFHWTGKTDGEHPQIQAVSSSRDMLSRRIDYEFIPMYPAVCEFCRVKRSDFLFGTPVTFCEFHQHFPPNASFSLISTV